MRAVAVLLCHSVSINAQKPFWQSHTSESLQGLLVPLQTALQGTNLTVFLVQDPRIVCLQLRPSNFYCEVVSTVAVDLSKDSQPS